mmetsp:Transcript_363/g.430  ORF Transcript_363/g.430 Transcript_363/m.430 type:complete len:315 (-) Transcript_363:110-1054(-)
MAVYGHDEFTDPTENEVELEENLKLEREEKSKLQLQLLQAKEEVTREKMSKLALFKVLEEVREELQSVTGVSEETLGKLHGEDIVRSDALKSFETEMGEELEESLQRQVELLTDELMKLRHSYKCEVSNHKLAREALTSLCDEMQAKGFDGGSESPNIENLEAELKSSKSELLQKEARVKELEMELDHKKEFIRGVCEESESAKKQLKELESLQSQQTKNLSEAYEDAGEQILAASKLRDEVLNLEKSLNLMRKQLRDTEKKLETEKTKAGDLAVAHAKEMEQHKVDARDRERVYLIISIVSIFVYAFMSDFFS